MSSNAVWFTYHLEFDLVAQAGAVTEQACKQAVRDLALDQKVQVIPLKTPRTRTVYGVDVRYAISGPQMLTAAQIAALDAQLRSVFAMYFVDATPEPLQLAALDGTAGIALSTALPYVSGQATDIVVSYASALGANTGGANAGSLSAGPSGNAWTDGLPNTLLYPYTSVYFRVFRASADPVIMVPASASLVLKDINEQEIPILRTKDIVLTPNDSFGFGFDCVLYFYLGTNGKLYLSYAYDHVIANPTDGSWDAVIAGGAW